MPISSGPHQGTVAARTSIGLDDFRVHDLRRTAASRMAELGISPHTISLVLNHVSARKGTITGKVYITYSYDKEKREALNAWGVRLEEIVSPSCPPETRPNHWHNASRTRDDLRARGRYRQSRR
jgi:hypothetical protein